MELANAHALVLDDDAELSVLVRKLLEGAGMRVREAYDIDRAFEAIAQQVPHVIFSDLDLNGQSGYEFIERVRAAPALRDVPVIVLSAHNDPKSVHRAVSLGASDYLVKPFQAAGLIQKTRKALMKRDLRRYEFPEGRLPAVQVTVPCTLVEAGEAGFRVDAAIRLGPETPVCIESVLLEKLGVAPYPLRASPQPPMLRQEGRYLNEARAVGLPAKVQRKIRETMKGR